jgi:hypothetical protein
MHDLIDVTGVEDFIPVLLACCPLGTWEAFQKGTPANGSLFTEMDVAPRVEGGEREVITPSVEGKEDHPSDGWVGDRT